MHNNRYCLILSMLAVISLTACETVKETAGLNRKSPDEFMVVKHPPLTVPPDFELRPPKSTVRGAAEPKEPASEAKELLFSDNPAIVPPSDGLTEVLNKAGAKQANPNIRGTLDQEANGVVVKDPGFVDRLMIWNGNSAAKPDPTVDAAAEAARLNALKAKQAPVSGKNVKTQPGVKAPLEGAFE